VRQCPKTTAKTSPGIEIHPQTALKAKFKSLRLYFLRHGETTASQTDGYYFLRVCNPMGNGPLHSIYLIFYYFSAPLAVTGVCKRLAEAGG